MFTGFAFPMINGFGHFGIHRFGNRRLFVPAAASLGWLAGQSPCRVIPWVGRILDGWWRISATNSYLLFRFPRAGLAPTVIIQEFR